MRHHQEKAGARADGDRHQDRRHNAGNQNCSSGQSVHAVGQVDGVAHQANPKSGAHHEPHERKHDHVGRDIGRLHNHLGDWSWRIGALERQIQHGGVDVLRACVQKVARDHSNAQREQQFFPHKQALARGEFAKARGEF